MRLGPPQITPEILALCKRDGVEPSALGIEITIKPARQKRSNDQNAMLWAILTPLAEHLGYDKSEIYEVVCCEALGFDEVEFRGNVIRRPRLRGSRMNTQEFSLVIDLAERISAEYGVAAA